MHPPRHLPVRTSPRRARRTVGLLAATLALAAGCTPAPPLVGTVPNPNPLQATFIANHWGSQLSFTQTDVAYGPAEHHRLDVLEASSSTTRGTLVFVHGGGFVAGDKSQLLGGQHGALVYQRTRGWDLVSVGYRVGEGTYPAGYHDVALAVAWVREHGAELGLDTSKVVLAGHSAGGSLAAMVGTTPGTSTPYGIVPRVDGWIAVSGLHDFVNGAAYITDPWGLPAGARAARSPVTTLDANDPPGYLVHADDDFIVRPGQSAVLHERAALVGANVKFDLVDTGPRQCRFHDPLCGANLSSLNRFLS